MCASSSTVGVPVCFIAGTPAVMPVLDTCYGRLRMKVSF